jgi:hypothetical protein
VSTERDIKALIKVLERIIASFKSEEVLSDFERGQLDGLRWAVQLAQEVE